MESTRKGGVAPRGRFLVAMRPEPAAAADTREMARLLGLSPELTRDVLGGALPRIIGSRSSLEEAESLARVLTARGRESIAWDRELPLVTLIQGERLLIEGGQFILEQRNRVRRFIQARDVLRIVDLRLRGEPGSAGKADLFGGTKALASGQQLPDRALLIVPELGRGDPGVLSTRSVAAGSAPVTSVAAAQILQEAVTKCRALLRERVMEVRTTPAALGLEASDGDPLERVLQLLARLPPTPAAVPLG
ncbi:hypothetical protein [Hyalangium gracile]|uniref:hypothetical protein n=1 Tax=Hyalangium gracile TaxID=394092 RepID=UPI001CCF7E18|nr:hypothetical protein [Hyalangium gracile]